MSLKYKFQGQNLDLSFPVLIEWVIDKKCLLKGGIIRTKKYKVPGFPMIAYYLDIDMFDSGLCFCMNTQEEEDEEDARWDANLNLVINDKEPIKISEKFQSEYIYLWEDSLENVTNPGNNYFVKEEITFHLYGTISFHKISCAASLPGSQKFIELEKDEATKDFVIQAEKKEIKVHKEVLREFSTVFTAMFENGWKEAVEGRVEIPDSTFNTIETVIYLCYGGNLYSWKEEKEFILLYQFAEKYDMNEIKNLIKEVILLTPGNICYYANIFYKENCVELVNFCIDRLFFFFQLSYPVEDLEALNHDIKIEFFARISANQTTKKEFPPGYHINKNNEKLRDAGPLWG
uniref:BTB domain-containing protein n=1 Tax=Panagrolaimus davidi TaxID=227884 RepID=A0A914QK99_9BILA